MLKKMKTILNGELVDIKDLSEDLDINNDLTYFKYDLITPENEERSFSACKILLTNKENLS